MSIYDYEIEICGWKDFYENDTRRKQWIKLDCNIMTHPKIKELTSREFRLFICILTTKGRQKTDKLSTTSRQLADDCLLGVYRSSTLRRQLVDKMLTRLEQLQLVTIIRLADVCHENGARIEENRREEITLAQTENALNNNTPCQIEEKPPNNFITATQLFDVKNNHQEELEKITAIFRGMYPKHDIPPQIKRHLAKIFLRCNLDIDNFKNRIEEVWQNEKFNGSEEIDGSRISYMNKVIINTFALDTDEVI